MSKGKGLKREGEASFPFLCFWFLLSQYKRNILFSFPWKRNSLSFLLEEMQVRSCFPKQGDGWYFSPKREKYPKALFRGSHSDPWSKAGSPALRLRLFCPDFQSVPACTTTVLLQVLQCLAVVIHFTQSLYGLSLSRLRQTIVLCFPSILQLLQTLRIPERLLCPHLSMGMGSKREGESPFPFPAAGHLFKKQSRTSFFCIWCFFHPIPQDVYFIVKMHKITQ